jgi:molecular chaperone GrpE
LARFSDRPEDFLPVDLPEDLNPDYSTFDLLSDLLRKVGRTGQKTAQSVDLMRSDFDSALELLKSEVESGRKANASAEADLKAVEGGFLELMDILDNLQRAAESIEDRAFLDAVSVAVKAKTQIMERIGIQQIPGKGASFDIEVHFVTRADPVDSPKLDNTVTDVIQNGYRRGSRLLRKATVVCGKYGGQ